MVSNPAVNGMVSKPTVISMVSKPTVISMVFKPTMIDMMSKPTVFLRHQNSLKLDYGYAKQRKSKNSKLDIKINFRNGSAIFNHILKELTSLQAAKYLLLSH